MSANEEDTGTPAGACERAIIEAAQAEAQGLAVCRDSGRSAQLPEIPGYRIYCEVAHGGQGIVYKALQVNTARVVAVKVLLEGRYASKNVRKRFLREARLSAKLNHPNIVTIHDSGITPDEQPYYVMEWINGETLKEFNDSLQSKEDISARQARNILLNLFVKISDAVNHAHQHETIHRDLKPANILIDRERAPHILDFGLAKLTLHEDASSEDALTLTAGFVGTLPFASPEQVGGGNHVLTTKTDIYSLGVIMYKVLTGEFPYSVSGSTEQIRSNIQNVEPAPTSRWLGRVRRDTTRSSSSRMAHLIDGALESILLRTLAKDPQRRYDSAAHLRDDLENYLSGRPVNAKRDSWWYRARIFVRRRLGLVAAVAAVILGTTSGMFWALHERTRTQSALDKALAVQKLLDHQYEETKQAGEFNAEILRNIDLAKTGDVMLRLARDSTNSTDAARALLDECFLTPAVDSIDKDLAMSARVEAEIRGSIGATYRNFGLFDKAEAQFRGALEIRQRQDAQSMDTAVCMHNLAALLYDQAKYQEAATLIRKALAIQKHLKGPNHPDVAIGLNGLGVVLKKAGQYEDAVRCYREALPILRSSMGESWGTGVCLNNLARLLLEVGEHAEAERFAQDALKLYRQLPENQQEHMITTLNILTQLFLKQREWTQAESYARQALESVHRLLGTEHPEVATSLNTLGMVLQSRKDYPAALAQFSESLSLQRNKLSKDHPDIATTLNNLGWLFLDMGEPEKALGFFQDCLSIREAKLPNHVEIAFTRRGLAEALRLLAQYGDSEFMLLKAWDEIDDHQHVSIEDKRLVLESIIKLYDAWHHAEPSQGYDAKAAEWRAKLAEGQANTQPAIHSE